jgi:hypothetical protein
MMKAVQGDVIWFTEESMNKIYTLFGVNNDQLKEEFFELRNTAINLIKCRKGYSDNIEQMSSEEALTQLFRKATFPTAVESLNIPMSNIPDKYLVRENNGGVLKLELLNDNLYFSEDHKDKWVRFKESLKDMEFKEEEYPHYVMGVNF